MNSRIIPAAVVAVALAGSVTSTGLAASSGTSHRPAAPSTRAMGARRTVAAGASAFRVYDDRVGDVSTAPDIGVGSIATNDNESITFGLNVRDRSSFEPFDSYSVVIDADSSALTGSVADGGGEFLIDVSGRTSALTEWTGSDFELVVPQPRIQSAWMPGYGPAVSIARRGLGDPQRFNFVLESRKGSDRDIAPDIDAWPYRVKPLELTTGKVRVGPARAGGQLRVSMSVIRSDFGVPLAEGVLRCEAAVASKRLRGHALASDGLLTCTWRVPKWGRGRRIRGSVAVTYQHRTASGSFSVLVERKIGKQPAVRRAPHT